MDYSLIKSIWSCLECWPRMCQCKCPHGVWMNMECAECERVDDDKRKTRRVA